MAVSTLQLISIALLFLTLIHTTTSSTSQFAVGLTDPVPTFVTSEYVVVDRIVTLFCLRTCGGECEACCSFTPDVPVYQTIAYMEICKGRLGLERAICLELKSNLEFICTKSSYKYKTDQPVQEFKLEKVFNNKRDVGQLTSRPALGISTSNPIPLSISKRGLGTASTADVWKGQKDGYDDDKNDSVYANPSKSKDPKSYISSADPAFDYEYYFGSNSTKIPYQEVFVCASRLGGTHYRPINPITNSSSNGTVPKPFWQISSNNKHAYQKDDYQVYDKNDHYDDKNDHQDDKNDHYGHYDGHQYRDDDHGHHDGPQYRGKPERNGHRHPDPKYGNIEPAEDFYTFKNEYYEIFGGGDTERKRERKYH